jgi:hypothetical protein
MKDNARLRSRALQGPRLLEAAALLTATRLVLLVSPRRATASLLRQASTARPANGATSCARDVAQAVNRVSPWVLGSTCLSRALTGWLMLRRRGVPSIVRVGARQEGGVGVRMHAWLEVAGAPIIGSEEAADFVALTR